MIIPIKPWLEIADAAASYAVGDAETDWNGLALSSSMEPDAHSVPSSPNRGVHSSGGGAGERRDMPFYHKSIMACEVMDAMKPGVGKQVFDGTLGGGGHSELFLEAGAHVIGCDQDQDALGHAADRLERFGDQFLPIQSNFSDVDQVLKDLGIDKVDGIFLDVGVSSWQLDSAERGFSFMKNGPLDMRMNRDEGATAAELVNSAEEDELGRIFREYGEERSWRKAARAIVAARETAPIETTERLSEVIGSVIPKRGKRNPATKVFQALRIAVNDELGRLETVLEKAASHLLPGGVLAVITFHSLEDRIVKQFLKKASMPYLDRPEWPEPKKNPDYCYNLIQRRAIVPTEEEIAANPRSRSAKLRVGVRV